MFKFSETSIPGVLLITGDKFVDERGFFCESFRAEAFLKAGIPPFVQENHSLSKRGVVRGLHYQSDPMAIGKLVRCTRGILYDVAVDMRKNSPTYGKHFAKVLHDEAFEMIYVPEGFAHGFCAMEPNTEIMYKTTGYYSKEHDRGIRWNDPALGIEWPDENYIVSDKDSKAPFLADL